MLTTHLGWIIIIIIKLPSIYVGIIGILNMTDLLPSKLNGCNNDNT